MIIAPDVAHQRTVDTPVTGNGIKCPSGFYILALHKDEKIRAVSTSWRSYILA